MNNAFAPDHIRTFGSYSRRTKKVRSHHLQNVLIRPRASSAIKGGKFEQLTPGGLRCAAGPVFVAFVWSYGVNGRSNEDEKDEKEGMRVHG